MRNLHYAILPLAVATLAAGCAGDTTTPLSQEMLLAQQAEGIAQDEIRTTHRAYDGWLSRLLEALRNTDDPEAQAFLDQAREYRAQARAAFEAGQFEEARQLHQMAFRALLSAVVEVFPDAPVHTGEVVDGIVDRIETFLGDRDAPRIRAILTHVGELRDQAEAALASEDPVTALALNLRALQILRRLVHHVRDHVADHDRDADTEMQAVDY